MLGQRHVSSWKHARSGALALGALLSLAACAAPEEAGPEELETTEQPELAAAQAAPSLARGTREVLVSNIPSVENALFTSSGKLLVSGDAGLYELVRGSDGRLTASNLRPGEACKFSGIAELDGYVYAACYDGTRSFLFAAEEPTLALAKIAEISGVGLANGVAADTELGHLYVSDSGKGKIVRLTITDGAPLAVAKQEIWRSGGILPNGIDIAGRELFWGEYALVGTLRRVSLDKPRAQPSVVVTQLSFLDDFHVDEDRLLVTDFLLDTVRAFDRRGRKLSQTPAIFKGPSSVLPARGRLGLGEHDLIVTEKFANLVSVYRLQ